MAIPGEVEIVDDVPAGFADRLIDAFRSRSGDTFSLALSGGETARSCYEVLAATAGSQIDWWKVDIYWADERYVPHDHPDSNYVLARDALLDRVGAANATHLMRCTEGPDPYQLRLGELGGLDVVHLSVGTDGHVASLFPGSPALDTDPGRLVTMSHDPSGVEPHERMTLTLAGIARARQVIVTVMGADMAPTMAAIAADDQLPAARISADQIHWLVDPAAAAELDR